MPLQLQDCLHLLGWLKPPSKLLDIHLKFCAGKSIFTFVAFEMRHMLMNVLKRKTKEKGVDWLDHNFGLKVFLCTPVCACDQNASLCTRSDIRENPNLLWIIQVLTTNTNIFNLSPLRLYDTSAHSLLCSEKEGGGKNKEEIKYKDLSILFDNNLWSKKLIFSKGKLLIFFFVK